MSTKITNSFLCRPLFVFFALVVFFVVATQAQQRLPDVGWVRVPAGSFEMGCVPADMRCDADEEPRHRVTVTRPFDMMATEVTKAMYNAVMPEEEQPAWSTSPEHPIAIVDWAEATKFCQAVGGRLPTEAEWEYAARGGRAATIYAWGNEDPADQPGARNGATFETDSPARVKSFAPNGFGLYDMSGNVWEWVNDRYGAYPEAAVTDPQGPVAPVDAPPQAGQGGRGQVAAAQFRIVRGGSYGDDPRNLRLSNRTPNRANAVNQNVGFRCARSS